MDVADAALRIVEIANNIDMSDQVKDKLNIRIGIHTGSATGVVAKSTVPK